MSRMGEYAMEHPLPEPYPVEALPLNRHTLDRACADAALIKQQDHALGFVLETLLTHAERNEAAVRVLDRLAGQVEALETENRNAFTAIGALLERVEKLEDATAPVLSLDSRGHFLNVTI